MAEKARETLHRERQVLWSMKKLLFSFRGDDAWMPVGKMEAPHDLLLLNPSAFDTATQSLTNDTDTSMIDTAASVDVPSTRPPTAFPTASSPGPDGRPSAQEMADNGVESNDMAADESEGSVANKETDTNGATLEHTGSEHPSQLEDATTAQEDSEMANADATEPPSHNEQEPPSPTESASNQPQHRMTTRARARTPTSPGQNALLSPSLLHSPSPAPSSIPPIHGFFNVPSVALPDRDFGLPANEAEETRRLLILFVQKQDQIVREAEQMFEGLLKADRLRKDVYRWSKAEAHVGEMSDGEDWYDKEEWKLDADLLKGKEEEEVEEEGRGKGRRRRGAQH